MKRMIKVLNILTLKLFIPDEDREDPVIKNREEDIKETSRPEVMKELKKRRSLNKKIRTDNKTKYASVSH